MRAPFDRIFPLAAEVERWPEILPHYRYVRPVPDPNGERRFAMGARRGAIPVSWEAIQRPLVDERRSEFVHWMATALAALSLVAPSQLPCDLLHSVPFPDTVASSLFRGGDCQ